MFSAAAAARFIDAAHASRARYENLPEAIAPGSVAEAYAAQASLVEMWRPRLGPPAGLKIATTTRIMQELMGIDHPCMGTIFSRNVHDSPATIDKSQFINVRIECELALCLDRDLARSGAPYTRDSVRAAVAGIMPAFELIEDRFADYRRTKALTLIADNAWNGGIVLGPTMPLPADLDLDGIGGVLRSSCNESRAGNTDDPLGALAWLANTAAEHNRSLTAGMVVITGSVIPSVDIAVGERLDFALQGIGEVSLTAA